MVPDQEPHQGDLGHVDGEGEGLLPHGIEPCRADRTHCGKQAEQGPASFQEAQGTGHSSSNDNPIVSVIRCDRSASRIALKTKRVCLGAGRDTQASPETDTDIDTDGFELLHKGD